MTMGIGAMLHSLGGGSENPSKYYGKTIKAVAITPQQLFIQFEDRTKIRIWDDAQSCCESRYMSTDDNPQDLVGKKLKHIMAKEGPEIKEQYGDVHDQVFVEIMTECGETVTLVNHNEHNGYYGGFGLSVGEVE